MKRIIILVILIIAVVSCSYMEAAEAERRERGVECRYNKRGGVENCRYMK